MRPNKFEQLYAKIKDFENLVETKNEVPPCADTLNNSLEILKELNNHKCNFLINLRIEPESNGTISFIWDFEKDSYPMATLEVGKSGHSYISYMSENEDGSQTHKKDLKVNYTIIQHDLLNMGFH